MLKTRHFVPSKLRYLDNCRHGQPLQHAFIHHCGNLKFRFTVWLCVSDIGLLKLSFLARLQSIRTYTSSLIPNTIAFLGLFLIKNIVFSFKLVFLLSSQIGFLKMSLLASKMSWAHLIAFQISNLQTRFSRNLRSNFDRLCSRIQILKGAKIKNISK